MAFNYEAARAANVSDDEIIDYLSKTRHFDVNGALGSGASKQEIIRHLGGMQQPAWESKKSGSFLGNAAKAVGGFAVDTAKSIAKPFVEAGVGAVALAEKAGSAITGLEPEAAQKALYEGYNVPGYGQITPVSIEEPKRVLGVGAKIASTVAGGGATKDILKEGAKGVTKKLIVQGAKEGAMVGGAAGFGGAIQEEDATPTSVLAETAGGAILGGAAGGAMGAAAPYTSKAGREAIQVSKAAKNQEEIVKTIMPKVDKKKAFEALRKGEAGVEDATILAGGKVKPTDLDRRIAASASDYVKPKASPVKNITSINDGIADISENKVAPFLKEQGQNIDKAALSTKLQSVKDKMPLSLKNDTQLGRIYDGVIAEAEKASANATNSFDLWEARKAFDTAVKREFGDKVLNQEGRNVRDIAIKDIRHALNEHIAETTPDDTFRSLMSKLSDMYTARDRIAEKAAGTIDKTKLQQLLEQYPNLKKIAVPAITTGLAGTGLGYFLKEN